MSANGRLDGAELVTVQGAQQLAPVAALAYRHWLAAATTAKTRIAIPIDGAYRSFERQEWMHNHPKAYPGKSLARPGFSPHGLGICVDIVGDLDWAIKTAPDYGFSRPITGDINHFQHNGRTTGPASAGGTTTIPFSTGELDMLIIHNSAWGHFLVVPQVSALNTKSQDAVNEWKLIPGIPEVTIPDTMINRYLGYLGVGIVENGVWKAVASSPGVTGDESAVREVLAELGENLAKLDG